MKPQKIRMVNEGGDGGLSFSTPSETTTRQLIALMQGLGYRICTAEEIEAAKRRGRVVEEEKYWKGELEV